MPRQGVYNEEDRARYVTLRNGGLGNLAACREMNLNHKTGTRWWQDYRRQQARLDYTSVHPPKSVSRINQDSTARRALNDFVFFRLIVFGRKTPPWAAKAAEMMREAIESDRKEFSCMNLFPGAGKTVFYQDLVCWLIARNRSIRIMWGSASDDIAERRVNEIRAHLERLEPWEGNEVDIRQGRAVKPKRCMVDLFGRFRPSGRHAGRWRAGSFTVCTPAKGGGAQEGPPPAGPTLLALGPKTRQIGNRAEFIVWDDLWTRDENENPERGKVIKRFFDHSVKTRLQPEGVLVLVMQRLGPADLSRYVLDKQVPIWDPETGAETGFEPLYRHIVFPAHHDDLCDGLHPQGRPAWDPDNPQVGNCLTDPLALPPQDYVREKMGSTWLVEFQQRDVDPQGAIFREIWLTGGKDEDGDVFPGCLDRDRDLWELPKDVPVSSLSSAMSVDPGVDNYWGLYASVHSGEDEWILCADHRRMPAGTSAGLLDWDFTEGKFVGIMEEWWQHSKAIGVPFTHVVAEYNAAQKLLFRNQNVVDKWQKERNCRILGHECVDPETEVLSQRGWLRHDEVAVGDHILTLNMTTDLCEWKPVEYVYRGHHVGEMHRMRNRSIDSLTTPEHRWPTTDQDFRPLRFTESRDLTTTNVIPLGRPFNSAADPPMVVGDDLVELVGWAVTEGHFAHVGTGIVIGQSERVNPDKVKRIRACLDRLGAHWTEGYNDQYREDRVRIFKISGPVATLVRQITGSAKDIPASFISTLTTRQRLLLRDTMVAGDGWVTKDGRGGIRFCSNDQALIDAFQMLCALEGDPTTVHVRQDRSRTAPHYTVVAKRWQNCYLANHRPRFYETEQYDGLVWCPNTVNGTFLARRNGRTYFTGNTKKNKNDPKLGVEFLLAMRFQLGAVRFPWRYGQTQITMRVFYNEIVAYKQGGTTWDIIMAAWMRTLNRRRIQRAVAPVPSEATKPVPPWIEEMAARRAGSLR